jgi:ribosomal protein L29
MEFKELKKKTEIELHKFLAESRASLRELRFKDANKQLKNVRQLRAVRAAISRTLTLINSLKKNQSIKAPESILASTENKGQEDKK